MKKLFFLSFLFITSIGFPDNCPGDINKDGIVSAADLNLVITQFQQNCACIGDINGDGTVSAADLNILIPNYGKSCSYCGTDKTKNSVTVINFDSNGKIYAETKAYSDRLGRPVQTQSLNLLSSQGSSSVQKYTLGTQTVVDAFGRGTLQTLPAPVVLPSSSITTYFCYKDGFIANSSNANYSYTDFDVSATLNNPGTVNSSNAGTLGWYYSNNNTSEPYVPADAFPYTRVEYYSDPLNRIKRSTVPGSTFKMGSNHEQQRYYMSNAGELYYAFGYKGAAIIGTEDNGALYKPNENLNAAKTIVVDADGKVTIAYQTLTGLSIATCRSGAKDAGCINQKVSQQLLYAGERGASIHLPPACNHTLSITGITENITYRITDLSTGKILNAVSDYTFNPVTHAITFSSNYQNKHLFLRISYDYTAAVQPASRDYLTVWYELDYDNWSLQLYDTKGQAIATVPPAAMNCTYDIDVNNTLVQSYANYDLVPSPFTQSLQTVSVPVDSTKSKNVFYTITSPSKWLANRQSSGTTTYDIHYASATSSNPELEAGELDLIEEPANAPAFTDLPTNPNILRTTGGAALTFKLYSNNSEITAVPPAVLYMDVLYECDKTKQPPLYNQCKIVAIDSIPGMPAAFAVSDNLLKQNNYSSIELRMTDVKAATRFFHHNNVPRGDFQVYTASDTIALIIDKLVDHQKVRVARQVIEFPVPNPYTTDQLSITTYNKLGWPVKTVSPDEGRVDVIYDTEGKVRFTCNQQQAAENKFSYLNYDRAGRVVETGEYDPSLQAPVGNPAVFFVPYNSDGSIPPGSNTVHTIVNLPDMGSYNHRRTQQTYFTYDLPQADFPSSTYPGYNQQFMDAQLVKTANSLGQTWYGYNFMGLTGWKVNTVNGLGTKTINYTYDNDGLLTKSDYQKETAAERFVHQYLYDAGKRLQEVKTSFNNTTFTTNQALKYYLHGALKRNELGGTLQGLDYVYTLNGQLKSLNDPTLTNRDPGKDSYSGSNSAFKKDVFGFTLDYFTGDYNRQNTWIETYASGAGNTTLPALYNGQIRAMRWQTTLPTAAVSTSTYASGMLQYAYQYDYRNQLDKAIFGTITAGTLNGPTTGTNPVFAENANEYRVDDLSYDRNGNIRTLSRKGKSTGLTMDILTYNYQPARPNRLTSISDATAGLGIYTDDIEDQPDNNYQYNSCGQLIKDTQADYNYTYNLSGNVTGVKKTNGTFIAAFEYNEAGSRQKKTSYDAAGNPVKHTWYVYDAGGALLSTYETAAGNTLQTELQLYGAGRLGIYNRASSSYIYELTDHLGNVRATIRNNAGNAEVISFSDYYPHGYPMPGRNHIGSINYRNANYQGQEKDNETGLLNFELRQFDPRIGRWFNPDPFGQYHSPYLAMNNNPVSFVDPTGGWSDNSNWSFEGDDHFPKSKWVMPWMREFGSSEFDGEYFRYGGNYGGSHNANGGYTSNQNWSDGARDLYFQHLINLPVVTVSDYSDVIEIHQVVQFALNNISNIETYFGGNLQGVGWNNLVNLAHNGGEGWNREPLSLWEVFANGGRINGQRYDYNGKWLGKDNLSYAVIPEAITLLITGPVGEIGAVAKTGSRVFEVGSYNTLKGVEAGLEAHHVGQRALMKKFVPGYNANTAPSILVPKQGHTLGKGVTFN